MRKKNILSILIFSITLSILGCSKQQNHIINDIEEGTTIQEKSSDYLAEYETNVLLNNHLNEIKIEEQTQIIKEEISTFVLEETSLSINTNNVKKEYFKNEILDLNNLIVTINFNDGTSKNLTNNDYSINTIDFSKYGTKEVIINYKNFTQSFYIDVIYEVIDIEDHTKYTTTALNLRSGPGTEFEIVSSININTPIIVIGQVDNWVKIIYNNKEYFCSNKYLSLDKTYIVNDVVPITKYTQENTSIKLKPDKEVEDIKSLSKDIEILVTGETSDGWYRISYNNNIYYCLKDNLSNIKTQKEIETVLLDKIEIIEEPTIDKSEPPIENKPIIEEEIIEIPEVDYSNVPYCNIIYGEEGTNQDIVNAANKLWNEKVPANIKEFFVENGWSYGISKELLHIRYGYDTTLAGITIYKPKQCFLDNRMSTINRALLHELGHALDCLNGFISNTSEWLDIYNSEKFQFVDITPSSNGHNISNEREYFANIFENIIVNTEQCKINTPRSYDFMNSLINSIKMNYSHL